MSKPRVVMDPAKTFRRLVPVERLAFYVDIETRACVEPKQFHDVVGYDNRFDVFNLTVHRTRQRPASFRTTEPPPAVTEQDTGEWNS